MSNSKELKLSNQFQELSKNEMSEVNGGGILGAIIGAVVGAVVGAFAGGVTVNDKKLGVWEGIAVCAGVGGLAGGIL